MMTDLFSIRPSTIADAHLAAKLSSFENNSPWESLLNRFQEEFTICANQTNRRIYFLAFSSETLVAYAGARYYDQSQDENMYDTENLLPSGWYLRGIRVHPDWRRKGLAKILSLKRLEWVFQRSKTAFVFLDDENKVTLALYRELGFKEVSGGWTFSTSERFKTGNRGILLKASQ